MSFFRLLQEHGAQEAAGHAADTASHAAEAAAHGAEAAGHAAKESLSTLSDIPEFIEHHLADTRELEFAGGHLDLSRWAMDPIHIGPLSIDLSPTRQLLVMLAAGLLVILLFTWVARRLRAAGPERAPSGLANAMEAMVLFFRDDVVRPNIGHGADRYTPFILTVFFFILFMNLAGLTPLGVTPTGNLSVTAGLALIAFVVIEVSGMLALGPAGYARTIFYLPPGLPTLMKPIMLVIMAPVEFLGKLTKPFALAIRLFANMMAGHILILALVGIILVSKSFAVGIGAAAATSVLMILELFVAFLQAYIFAMLTSVFIGLIRHAH
ncbi:MAG: ATP synthase F0 subunit A [Gemmatimonadetes bacterium]|nr:MAG: ATP synthase F0 subunit A [Gemmatimonadota bacterium]